ncbi:MAG: MFS transporter [Candidatus Dormiibacterota bacterium]
MRGIIAALRNGRLVALMFGHMTVDSYVGVIPILYPILIGRFHLDLATVGILSFAYTGASSLSQPFFGLVADRWGTRFVGGAMLWTAAWFAVLGFAPSFPAIVVAAGIAGLGSGFFHPLGAVTVRKILPSKNSNVAMAVYVSGGTVGVALGPLLGVIVFGLLGLHGTALLLVPGLVCSALLLAWMSSIRGRPAREPRASTPGRRAAVQRALPLVPLVATIVMMMSRSWTTITIEAYIPTWYHQLGYQPWFYGPLATTVVLASAAGTVGCGSLADRFGRRTVVIGSLVLSIPVILLFVLFPGPQAFVTGALVGLLAASTAPLMLLIAQELLAARAGLASGLVLGVGFMTGAIGVPVTGLAADHWGLATAMLLQVVIVVLTVPLALLLPSERFLQRWKEDSRPLVAEPAAAPQRTA